MEKEFQRKLVLCKGQYLSKGGRFTLIKSMLSSLPIIFMSLFFSLRNVSLKLEQMLRGFLGVREGLRESLIWLIGLLFDWTRRMKVLALEVFMLLTRLSLANEVGNTSLRGSPFENMS